MNSLIPLLAAAGASPAGTSAAAPAIPPERTVIFPEDKAESLLRALCYTQPRGITGYWTPTQADLAGMENVIEPYLATFGREPRDDWHLYHLQATGVMRGARRFVFASYFMLPQSEDDWHQFPPNDPRGETDGWKTVPFWVADGGDTYFRVLYDRPHNQFIWFEKNIDTPTFG